MHVRWPYKTVIEKHVRDDDDGERIIIIIISLVHRMKAHNHENVSKISTHHE
jgi:hypothetical protein